MLLVNKGKRFNSLIIQIQNIHLDKTDFSIKKPDTMKHNRQLANYAFIANLKKRPVLYKSLSNKQPKQISNYMRVVDDCDIDLNDPEDKTLLIPSSLPVFRLCDSDHNNEREPQFVAMLC